MKFFVATCSIIVLTILQDTLAEEVQDVSSLSRQSKLGILPTNSIAQMAQDLLTRSSTSSQVLSLNLTNLVIMLVIKALIYGAGSFGFGGASDHLGRSVDNQTKENTQDWLSQSDVTLMLSYMNGAVTGSYDCLNIAACQDPNKAKDYLNASNWLVKGAGLLNLAENREKYENVLSQLDEAIKFGAKGYECSSRYKCKI